MTVATVGSINWDHFYHVTHFVQPGQTLTCHDYSYNLGGKGANQSVAAARAGADVTHIGCIGPHGQELEDALITEGVDTQFVQHSSTPTGHAMIQVRTDQQVAVVSYPGANHELNQAEIEDALTEIQPSWIMVQNELPFVGFVLEKAHELDIPVCLNPAPMRADVAELPLEQASLLVLNHWEAQEVTGGLEPPQALAALAERCPDTSIIITLGSQGIIGRHDGHDLNQGTYDVESVDHTGGGDAFIGYLVGLIDAGTDLRLSLQLAMAAGSLTTTRVGVIPAIPTLDEARALVTAQPDVQ